MIPGCKPGRRHLAGGLAALLAAPCSARAQAPRPGRLIVPIGPGTSPDINGRIIAEAIGRLRGLPLVVENKPGADGVLGAEAFARSRPGEALLHSFTSIVTVIPLMYPNLPYDPERDLVPVAAVHTDVSGLVVDPRLPVTDLASFVAWARAQPPGSLSYYASPGSPYLSFRAFLKSVGLDMTYVSYRQGAQALLDVGTGRLTAMLGALPSTLGPARQGQFRLLATTGPARVPAAAEFPTSAEQGFPALNAGGPVGLFGWRGITPAEAEALAAELRAAMALPGVRERIAATGAIPTGTDPAAFAAELAEHRRRWAALVREFGARPPE